MAVISAPLTHIGVIMDGNGRWAQSRGLPRLAGHRAGVENLRRVIRAVAERGIRHLTIYAFSTENWSRPPDEVRGLLSLIERAIDREMPELHRQGVQLRHLGTLRGLPDSTRRKVLDAMEITKVNQRLVLNIAFNYGGRDEIMRAIRRILADRVPASQIDEACVSRSLDTNGQPDPELIVRTAGELRLSNFLLWQSANAEFYATEAYWPDFDERELEHALAYFHTCRARA